MDLIEFYTRVANLGLMSVDEKGFLRATQKGSPPIMIGDRALVLPVRHQLLEGGDTVEFFHPLAENTILGLSNVSKKLLDRLNRGMNVGLTQIMSIVGIILTSPEIAGNFTSPAALKISEKLTIIPKSEKFDLLKILAKELESRPTSAFVEMEVSRSGKLRGTTMSRLAAVRFPFYRELKKDVEKTRKESTMNLSLEEVKFLIELHEAIVPGIDDPEAYNVGVGMWIAPFFTVMVKGAVGMLATLAESKQAFPGMFDDACVVDDDYSWVSVLDNKEALDRFSKQFSNMESERNPIEEPEKPVSTTIAPKSTPSPQPAAPTPTTTTASVPFVGNGQSYATPVAQQPAPQGGSKSVSYEEWANRYASPSPMAAQGIHQENIRRHNDSYRAFFNAHIQQYNAAPMNMPHPDSIPPGVRAPDHPNQPVPVNPQLGAGNTPPQQGGVPYMGQPQQGWGQPQQGWGQPQAGWGQPQQGWGQPQQAWGQPAWGNQNPWGGYRR